MNKLIAILSACLFSVAALAQNNPVRPGPVIITTPGGGTGTVSSNEVWEIVQSIGVGGGVVSNAFGETVSFLTWYTNDTAYTLELLNRIKATPGSGIYPSITTWIDSNLDGTSDYTTTNNFDYSGDPGNADLTTFVPAGWAYRFRITPGSGLATTEFLAGQSTLLYYGVGGGTGTGTVQTNTHWAATTNLTDRLTTFAATNSSPGRGLFFMSLALSSNSPVKFLNIGDSVAAAGETSRAIRRQVSEFLTNGGWSTEFAENPSLTPGGNLPFYMAGYTVNQQTNTDLVAPSIVAGISNNQVLTSTYDVATPPRVNRISVGFLRAGGTSLLLETNHNGGATWGTLRTLDTSGAYAYVYTNITVTTTNLYLRITSTGTNRLAHVGLYNDTGTSGANYQWGRLTKSGQTLSEVVTNAAFKTFYDNYAPTVLLIEVKDPVADLISAADYIKNNLTNSDNVFITSSPNLPDDGAEAARNALLGWGRTNAQMVFDKYAMLTPTNYWFDKYANGTYSLYVDGVSSTRVHLGGMGIDYVSGGLAKWLNLPPMFAQYGFTNMAIGASVAGKANLAGGNTFTGSQYFEALTTGAGNTSFNSTGTLAGFNFQSRNSTSLYGRLWMGGSGASSAIYIAGSAWGTDQGLILTNNNGLLGLYADPAFNWAINTPSLGTTASPWWLTATNSQMYGATRFLRTGNTNAFAYFASDGTLTNGVPLGLTNTQAAATVPLATTATTAAWTATTGTGAVVLSNAPAILGLRSTTAGNTNTIAFFGPNGDLTNAVVATAAFTNAAVGRMLIPGTSYYITIYTNVP